MKKCNLLAVLFIAVVGVGCKKIESVKTVTWYKMHDAERKEVIKECNNNPGELALTPDCQNAYSAETAQDAAKRGGINVKPLTAQDFE